MPIKKIEQLEELIKSAIASLNNLHAEKLRLEQRVRELEKEKEVVTKENARSKDSMEKLKQLKISHRKLESDQSAVRVKVQNVLQELEKMDIV